MPVMHPIFFLILAPLSGFADHQHCELRSSVPSAYLFKSHQVPFTSRVYEYLIRMVTSLTNIINEPYH